jgi:hypothetical protein
VPLRRRLTRHREQLGRQIDHPVCACFGGFAHFITGAATPPHEALLSNLDRSALARRAFLLVLDTFPFFQNDTLASAVRINSIPNPVVGSGTVRVIGQRVH